MNIKFHVIFICLLFFVSCKKEEPVDVKQTNSVTEDLVKKDTPILPIKKGDYWKYILKVEIPPGMTLEGAPATGTDHEKIRTYLGKR